jgi:TRAP-type C4-dicarboxylate transport system permease large subunit
MLLEVMDGHVASLLAMTGLFMESEVTLHLSQLGFMLLVNLILLPYGLLLFMMTEIADVSLMELVREVLPFLGVMLVALAIVTLMPDLVLSLPRLAGYTG